MARAFRTACGIVGLAALAVSASSAHGQAIAGDRQYIRFDRAVRVPGATLPPGEYLFALGTPIAGQVSIDIYAKVGDQLIAACLGIESRLRREHAGSIIEFPNTPPAALRAWFRQGNAVGFEFVYGSAEAKLLYLETGEPVPFMSGTRFRREQIGTIEVAVSSQPSLLPTPVGTTGALPQTVQSLTPAQHLEAAATALASRLAALPVDTQRRLLIIIELTESVARQYHEGDMSEVRQILQTTSNTLNGLLAAGSSRFSGMTPLDRDTQTALERARAHLVAFSSFVRE